MSERYINDFKNYLKYELGLAANSVSAYVNDIVDMLAKLEADPLSVDAKDIIRYMTILRKSGSSIETILRRLSGIASFYDFLIKDRALSVNPVGFITKPKKWDKLPSYLNFDEVEKLIEAPDTSTAAGFRNRIIIELLYSTGVRISELINIKIADVDFKRGIIKVTGKGSKQRFVPVYNELAEKLDAYLNVRSRELVKAPIRDISF